jgi:hypothetical protein
MSLLGKKLANPLNFYNNPLEVDLDITVSPDEKIIILTNWLDDIIQRQTAESENMRPAHAPHQQHIAIIEELLHKYKGT